MLKDYIEAVANRIISSKRERRIEPACCTLHELMDELKSDTIECMRALHIEGKFIGSLNVNKIPMLSPKTNITKKTNELL